jgi:hypothetical protein
MRWAGHVAFKEELEYVLANNILFGRLEGKKNLRYEA